MNRFVSRMLLYIVLLSLSTFWGCGGEGTCRFNADCGGSSVCQDGKCVNQASETQKDASSPVDTPPDEPPAERTAPSEVDCQDGHTRQCYTGAEGTQDVGLCKAGTQTCEGGKWGTCEGEVVPVTEQCNSKDDNCDGRIDDGCDCKPGTTQACYTGPDGTKGVGPCKEGTQTCDSNGKWGTCQGDTQPQQENCNGLDDDCNGKVDDNLPPAPACKKTQGACQGAKQTCGGSKGWLPCDDAAYTLHSQTYEKEETRCDNIDNDCDGQVDEQLERPCYGGAQGCKPAAQGGFQCEGSCKAGTQVCRAGQWDNCLGQQMPETETCNGKDDNCDGQVDETCACQPGDKKDCYSGPTGTEGQGLCKKGQQTCLANGQWGSCSGEVNPRQEICNGQDDDCNGQTDEGLTGPACQKSFGVCAGLRQRCGGAQGWLACTSTDYAKHNTAYQNTETTCDNKDNDCDGSVDENLTRPCYTGASGTQGKGPCKGGIQTCLNGQYGSCLGEVTPKTESCNGQDDDCNGQIDDSIPGVGQSCTVAGQKGECAKGKRICQNNQILCDQVNQPKTENCTNNLDDDCNGQVDDCGVCTNGQTQSCYTGKSGCTKVGSGYQCLGACQAGTQTCVNRQWGPCQNQTGPSSEQCNWKDDDCNGKVDDQGACLYASWGPTPMPSGVREVAYLNPKQGIAVGNGGQIWRTTNAGQTWQSVTSPTTNTLYRVVALPQGLVLIVGSGGTILRSIDGGTTFKQVTSGTSTTFYGVAASTGFTHYAVVVGSGGTILTSTDGGETWASRSSGTSATLYSVAFSSATSSTMIAVGSSGTILTSSGGTTWTARTSGTTTTLRDVAFTEGRGVAVGGKEALRSTNSGSSWSKATIPGSPSLLRVVGSGSETFVAAGSGSKYYLSVDEGQTFYEKDFGITGTFTSIALRTPTALLAIASGRGAQGEGPAKYQEHRPYFSFYNVSYSNYDTSGNQIAMAVGSNGTLYRSENSGGTWQSIYLPTSNSMYSVSFYGTYAIAVGSSGTIFTSSDSGKTWTQRTSGTSSTLYSVVIDGANAIAVGSSKTLLHSTNRGVTWKSLTAPSPPFSSSTLYGVSMKGNTAVAVGSSGWVIRSTNAGSTWTRVGSNITTNTLRGVYYYPLSNTVVAVGSSGTILYSSNDGSTWTKATSGTTSSLYGVGADYGDVFVSGSNGTVLNSSDRGKTWTTLPSFFGFTLYGVFRNYLTGNYLIAGSSGSMFSSSDYGRTWGYSMLPSTTLYTNLAFGNSLFVAGGTSRVLFRTTDFGQNWTLQAGAEGSSYYGMARDTNTGTALIVGSSGTILRSTNNGQSWSNITSTVSNTLYGTAAATSNVFVVVGTSSTILRSTNGGTSFSQVTSPTSGRTLRDAACSGSLCLVVGSSGTIFRSTNAGASWATVTAPSTAYLYKVALGSSTRAVAVGSSGTIHYTTDGGQTWKQGTVPVSRSLYSVVALDANRYIAVDSTGHLLATADGGQQWSIHSPSLGLSLHSFSIQGSLGLGVGSDSLRLLYTKP